MKKLLFLLLLPACATTKVCPTVADEPVSMCRAEVACKPNFGQAFQAGQNGTMHILEANKNMCMSNHLEAQKANAALKVISTAN